MDKIGNETPFTFRPSALKPPTIGSKRVSEENSSDINSNEVKKSNNEPINKPSLGSIKLKPPVINTPSSESSQGKSMQLPSNYVFGKNIANRVTGIFSNGTSDICEDNGISSSKEVHFQNLADVAKSKSEDSKLGIFNYSKSLSESAAELAKRDKSKVVNIPKEPSNFITGEEDETTAMEFNCKLHSYEPEKSQWNNLGFCVAHLNDFKNHPCKSRLVIRLKNTLKVLLNTPIWANMHCSSPTPRTVHIGALTEGGKITPYLLSCNVENCDLVFDEIQKRVDRSTTFRSDKDVCDKDLDEKASSETINGSINDTHLFLGNAQVYFLNRACKVWDLQCKSEIRISNEQNGPVLLATNSSSVEPILKSFIVPEIKAERASDISVRCLVKNEVKSDSKGDNNENQNSEGSNQLTTACLLKFKQTQEMEGFLKSINYWINQKT